MFGLALENLEMFRPFIDKPFKHSLWGNFSTWSQTMIGSLPRLGDDETVESDESDECSDDADQQKILKQVNFPPEIERSDVNPSSMVTKVSRAIQKRVSRLASHMKTLESIPNKTDVHAKTLHLCLDLSYMVPWCANHWPIPHSFEYFGVVKRYNFLGVAWIPWTPVHGHPEPCAPDRFHVSWNHFWLIWGMDARFDSWRNGRAIFHLDIQVVGEGQQGSQRPHRFGWINDGSLPKGLGGWLHQNAPCLRR